MLDENKINEIRIGHQHAINQTPGQMLTVMRQEWLRQFEANEQFIREREEQISLILEASTDGFWDWNIQTGEIHFSTRLLALLGYSHEDPVPELSNWSEFVHPDDIPMIKKAVYEYLDETTSEFETEYRILTKGGVWKWILARGRVLVRDEQDKPLVLAATCFDITERKQLEEALRLSEDKFAKAFNASPITMGITTLEEGRIMLVNDSFSRILGYCKEEILGRTSLEIGFWPHPTDRCHIMQSLEMHGALRDIEIQFRRKAGELRLGQYSAEKLDIHGVPSMLSILTDITELRQMEIEMLRMDRLNLVGEMAATIGHEIRNPLTSIRGFLQIFKDKYIEDMEFLNIMIAELDRANSIITEYLSLAQNKMVELAAISLNTVLLNIAPLIQASATIQDKDIRIELQEVPCLLMDEKEIRQLILNLVSNGLEAMASGGNLTIRTFCEEGQVVLSVTDQGIGINPDVLSKLGTPFFTTKAKGTGLGLPVCYRIAARHNAEVDVQSNSDGTTFLVRFPAAIEQKTLF